MSVFNLSDWVRKQPHPSYVICDTSGGEKRVEVNGGGRQWRDLCKTIEELEPTKVTCYNKAGAVLRARSMTGADIEAAGAAVAAADTEIEVFARLLAAAHHTSTENLQKLITSLVEHNGSLTARAVKAESEVERLRLENTKLRHKVGELELELDAADAEAEAAASTTTDPVGTMLQLATTAAAQEQKPAADKKAAGTK